LVLFTQNNCDYFIESRYSSGVWIYNSFFSFTLKWFHVIIILLKIIDSLGPFLIVRCKKWEDL
jgi:hypothetical protein